MFFYPSEVHGFKIWTPIWKYWEAMGPSRGEALPGQATEGMELGGTRADLAR